MLLIKNCFGVKTIFIIQALLCMALCVSAQDTISSDNQANTTQSSDSLCFVVVERMPEFPGGQQAMFQFVAENIKYPVIAQQHGIQGRAICQFIIEKDGRVNDVVIVRSTGDAALDKEAIRIIESMPAWIPGMQKGKPVRVKYTLPINFRLGPGDDKKSVAPSNGSTPPPPAGQSQQTNINRSVPQFPGGTSKLNEYVKANIRYPKAAYDRGIRGKTVVEFLVEADGTISDVKVLKSATFKSLDDEAIRLVKSMPKWLPALLNGEPIAKKTTLPLGFGVK